MMNGHTAVSENNGHLDARTCGKGKGKGDKKARSHSLMVSGGDEVSPSYIVKGKKKTKTGHQPSDQNSSDNKLNIKKKETGQPWNLHPIKDAGWQVRTEVKRSKIAQAGSGRYVLEKVPAGTVVRRTKLIKSSSKKDDPTSIITPGTTIVSSSLHDLQLAFAFTDVEGQPTNDQQIVNFGGTPSALPKNNDKIYHWVPCNYFNHGAGHQENVEIRLNPALPDVVDIVAVRDIEVGEELYQDYRRFSNPTWFKTFCKEEVEQEDTETLGLLLSDAPCWNGSERTVKQAS